MKVEDLNLSEAERAELEAFGKDMSRVFVEELSSTEGAQEPPLMKVQRLRFQRSYVEEQLARAIADARGEGDSWHKIGNALGTTAEAARQRYRARVAA